MKTGGKIALISLGVAALIAVPIVSSALDDKAVGDKLSVDFDSLNINFNKASLTQIPGALNMVASNPLKKDAQIDSMFLDIVIDGSKIASVSKADNGKPIIVKAGNKGVMALDFNISPLNFLTKIGGDISSFISTKKFALPKTALVTGTVTFNGHVVDYNKEIPLKKS